MARAESIICNVCGRVKGEANPNVCPRIVLRCRRMATIPQQLNWVAKRAACNLAQVFHEICEGVLSDVKVVNEVRKLSRRRASRRIGLQTDRRWWSGSLAARPVSLPESVPTRIRLASATNRLGSLNGVSKSG